MDPSLSPTGSNHELNTVDKKLAFVNIQYRLYTVLNEQSITKKLS